MTHYLTFKYITDQRSFLLSLKSEKEIYRKTHLNQKWF